MKAVESEGTSVQEAVDRALMLLGMNAEDTEVVVLREPDDAATTPARVRVQVKNEPDFAAEPAASPPSAVRRSESVDVTTKPAERKDLTSEALNHVSRETQASRSDGDSDSEEPLTEAEGDRADRAGDFLEDLFEHLDIDCYVEVAADRVDGKILIDIGGPDTGAVIGRKGAVLDAIEFVVNRAMDNADGGGTRVALDAASYRARRTEKLKQVAADQAARVSRSRKPVSLEPMSPRERRIVHMALKSDPEVTTRSEGEGLDRHVIIEPIRA